MLKRKMLRDMIANKGSYLSCVVLIVLGLVFYLGLTIAVENMSRGKEILYEEENFAHGFAKVESMLKRDVAGLADDVEGIDRVSGRLVEEVRVYDEDRSESVYLKLISQKLDDPNRLNRYRVDRGEDLAEGRADALLDAYFIEAHRLEQGDTLEIIHRGRLEEITVSGTAMSPEIIYLSPESQIYPNPEQFGAGLMPLEVMWEMFPGMHGRVNDLVFSLSPGAEYHRVEEKLEEELEPYGLAEIHHREDHLSHFMVSDQIEMMELMGTFFPVVILSIAGVIILVLLIRIVEQQRTQIGILKAMGYSNREVLCHYLSYALLLAAAGGVLGSILGMLAAEPLSGFLMDEFFALPQEFVGFSPSYFAVGLTLCLAVMGTAGYLGSRKVLKLEPAEAMQPPAPPSMRKNILEKMQFFAAMLTVQGKMAVRNLGRSRGRSAFMFFGIAASCAMVISTFSLAYESVPAFLFHQHDRVETYDARINLAEPLPREAAQQEVETLPGIGRVEPIVEVPVEMSHRWREEEVELLGLTPESRLYNILDEDHNRVSPPQEGLIIAERLADNLDVRPGDRVEVDSPFFCEEAELEVLQTIPQYTGMNAYMEIAAAEEIAGQGAFATALLVEGEGTDSEKTLAVLHEHYEESEAVAGIDGWLTMREELQEVWSTMGVIVRTFPVVGLLFSFAIIYITSFIILSERSRELASMRVLGMTSREVLSVITFEQWFLAVFALLAGIPLAWLILTGFAAESATDMYTLPVVISEQIVIAGVLFSAFSIWVAQRFALKRVRKLDLVEVLKSRE